jgi:hypothetical protein
VNSVVGADEVRNTVQGIDLKISAAGPGHPSGRRRIRMGVELADYHGTGNGRRVAQVDTRLAACYSPENRNLSRVRIHVDPTALLVTPRGIIWEGILPGLVERVLDRRIVL